MKWLLMIALTALALCNQACSSKKKNNASNTQSTSVTQSSSSIRSIAQSTSSSASSIPPGLTSAYLQQSSNLSIFNELLKGANLTGDLAQANSDITLFVPTNDAFAISNNPEDMIRELTREPNAATLKYHRIDGLELNEAIFGSKIGQKLVTLDGRELVLSIINNNRYVNTAKILATHVTQNGVVHIIDRVLTPTPAVESAPTQTILEWLESKEEYADLANKIKDYGFAERLNDPNQKITFFAPQSSLLSKEIINIWQTTLTETQFLAQLSDAYNNLLPRYFIQGETITHLDLLTRTNEILTMSSGSKIKISINDGLVNLGETSVQSLGTPLKNGIVYEISYLLVATEE